MDTSPEIEKLKEKLNEQLQPYFEEGETYYSTPYTQDNGMSGWNIFRIIDGEKSYDGLDELEEQLDGFDGAADTFSELTDNMPSYRKLKYTFKKGQPISLEIYTPAMLIEDIRNKFLRQIKDKVISISTEVEFSAGEYGRVETHAEENMKIDGETRSYEFATAYEELDYLYYILDGKLKKAVIYCDKNTFRISADPGFPEWNIPEIEDNREVPDVDGADVKAVFEYMESGDPKKVEKAFIAMVFHEKTKEKANRRYLNLIQARTGDHSATLDRFLEAALSKKDISTIMGKALSNNYISYSYMYENDTRLIVDITGSLIKNHIDIDAFVTEAKECNNEDELYELIKKTKRCVRQGVRESIELYPDGWFGKAAKKFFDMSLEKVLFEKTSFDKANKSPVLKEYMLFLSLVTHSRLYMDIHQSDTPDLTEIFWMMERVPKTNWSDVEPVIPENPMKFKREAIKRIGDMGEWEPV